MKHLQPQWGLVPMKGEEARKRTPLTDEELRTLVYLRWNAPALFCNENLDPEYTPLVQKGYAYTKESPAPFRVSVRITQRGKNAILEENPVHVVTACMQEGLYYAAERIIKRLPREQLPELLTYDEPATARAYVRMFATERLEQLDKRIKRTGEQLCLHL